jgi:uncharacterized protein YceK
MKSVTRILSAAFALVLIQGCSTYVTHLPSYPSDTARIYRGTRFDAQRLREAIAPKKGDETFGDPELATMILFLLPLDLPLAIVADTLLLPYDLATFQKAAKPR